MLLNQEKELPLVSIIIPTYNRCHYLQEAIDSAVKQTYKNVEIIICDNCSTDNTKDIVDSFHDSRIRYWQQTQNIGMFANQIHACKMAKGKYVASLHDDDIWNYDFLEKLVPVLELYQNVALVFCDQYIIDANSNIDHSATERYTRAYKRHLLKEGIYQPFYEIGLINKSIPTATSCLIRNALIKWEHIPSEVGGMWDLYLTYLCCISGAGAYYYPEKLTKYREHQQTDTMLSGNKNAQAKIRKAKSEIFCYQQFMENPLLHSFQPCFRQKWLEAHTTLAIGLLRNQQTQAARPYLWNAIRKQKFNLRTIIALILSYIPQKLTSQIL